MYRPNKIIKKFTVQLHLFLRIRIVCSSVDGDCVHEMGELSRSVSRRTRNTTSKSLRVGQSVNNRVSTGRKFRTKFILEYTFRTGSRRFSIIEGRDSKIRKTSVGTCTNINTQRERVI